MDVQTSPGAKDLTIVRGMIRAASCFSDKAIIIENEVGMDMVYTMIALGYPEEQLAESFCLNEKEFKLLVSQSPRHRVNYLNAKLYKAGENSAERLVELSLLDTIEDGEKRAADIHHKTLATVLKGSSDIDVGNTGIVINNIIRVRDKDDIPGLPDELKEVIDVGING